MFWHLYKYKLKVLFKNKAMLFWTLIFPFVLGTFFHLALGNIGETFEFNVVDIAVVNNEEYQNDEILTTVIDNLSKKGDSQIFNTKYVDEDSAEQLLEDGEIEGYIKMVDEKPKLYIKNNGINQTIIKYALDEYYQMSNAAEVIISVNPENIKKGLLESLGENKNYIEDVSNEHIDFSINYFFTLIAMACLYGSLIGVEIIRDSEANLSAKGARVCITPANKIVLLSAGILAAFSIQIVVQILLFSYLKYALGVNFGSNLLATFVLSLVGCIAGLSLGTFVGVSNTKSNGFKIGFLIAIIMVFCFFAGMMGGPGLKATFDENLPILRYINPACIITDGLYALFAYDTLTVYYNCLIRIAVFAIIMISLTFIFVRRKSYDSI